MNRTDLQVHAVECGLKACAARRFQQHEVPEKAVVNDFYTHRLDKLLSISGVKDALESRVAAERLFRFNWNTVRDWDEGSRYDHLTTEDRAGTMLVAVIHPTTGVLPWLKTQW